MSKFAVLGTGMVGQVLAGRLAELGHEVMVGTRNVAETMARTEKDGYGNPPYSEWVKDKPGVKTGTFAEAAAFGDMVLNCTYGQATLQILQSAGAGNLNGKILIDISNPLDFSQGFPPSLTVCNTDSLAEQIQQAFPAVQVVKTLNTMNAFVMVNPALVPGDHSVFVSGNDATAKNQVKSFLRGFGWIEKNIIDLGDITTARGTEMLLPIWVRLYGALKTPMFNFHVNIAS